MENQNNLKNIWQTILSISRIVFEIFLILYLTFFLLDEIKKGFVSDFFNTNYLLAVCIISGILTALGRKEEKPAAPQIIKKSDYFLMTGITFLAIIIVFVKIKEIGFALALPISILSGILIFLISYLFLKGEDEEKNEL
jgi:magnesium-transporting ATPase (P-type)